MELAIKLTSYNIFYCIDAAISLLKVELRFSYYMTYCFDQILIIVFFSIFISFYVINMSAIWFGGIFADQLVKLLPNLRTLIYLSS